MPQEIQAAQERRIKFTDPAINNLKGGATELIYWDEGLPGFGVRVAPLSGDVKKDGPDGKSVRKTYLVKYRSNGSQRKFSIGTRAYMKLAVARAKAERIFHDLKEGIDPHQQRQEEEQASQTFAEGVTEYIETYAAITMRENSKTELKRNLTATFDKELGQKKLVSIKQPNIEKVVNAKIAGGKAGAARHALTDIKRFFAWAVEKKKVNESPCIAIQLGKEHDYQPRDRMLSDHELGDIYLAAEERDDTYGHIVRLLILTAARRSQIVTLEWPKVKFNDPDVGYPYILTVSKQRAKGSELLIPLTETARKIIKAIPICNCSYVFASRTNPDTHFSGYSKSKEDLDVQCGSKNEKGEWLWKEPWILHDFRRTFMTTMSKPKLGVFPQVSEAILDHKETVSGRINKVRGIYNLYEYHEEKLEALRIWEEKVLSYRDEAKKRKEAKKLKGAAD